MHVILNLAAGGGWPGHPAPEAEYPVSMQVDWVRVYSAESEKEPLQTELCVKIDFDYDAAKE